MRYFVSTDWKWLLNHLNVTLVHRGKVLHGGNENIDLDDIFQA